MSGAVQTGTILPASLSTSASEPTGRTSFDAFVSDKDMLTYELPTDEGNEDAHSADRLASIIMNDMLDAENAAQDPTNTSETADGKTGAHHPTQRKRAAVVMKGDAVAVKEETGRIWRAAVVLSASRNGRAVDILYTKDGKEFLQEKEHYISPKTLLRDPVELDKSNVLKPHWEALRHHLSKDENPSDDLPVNHVPLYLYMQEKNYKANPVSKGTLRLGTFNIKHFGAKKTHTGIRTRSGCGREGCARASPCEYCKEEQERMKKHDDERTRNLVEVIHQARCSVVFLQEIADSADTALLCKLLEKRHRKDYGVYASWVRLIQGVRNVPLIVTKTDQNGSLPSRGVGWRSTKIVGEHAMIYQHAVLASFWECSEDELKIECGLYRHGTNPLSSIFESATNWGGFTSSSSTTTTTIRRFDFSMQKASAARIPALFFLHNGQPYKPSEPDKSLKSKFRSIAVCSVHLAFGQGGKSPTREMQLEHLASLMPGAGYDETRCLYALLGDFNSNASVADKGLDFTNSSVGKAVMAKINESSPGHVLALQPGKKTSIGGQRYDEVIVHKNTVGRRHAHVYPRRDLLLPQMKAALSEEEQRQYKSVHMGFSNILSDHLLVYVDLAVPKPHRAVRA